MSRSTKKSTNKNFASAASPGRNNKSNGRASQSPPHEEPVGCFACIFCKGPPKPPPKRPQSEQRVNKTSPPTDQSTRKVAAPNNVTAPNTSSNGNAAVIAEKPAVVVATVAKPIQPQIETTNGVRTSHANGEEVRSATVASTAARPTAREELQGTIKTLRSSPSSRDDGTLPAAPSRERLKNGETDNSEIDSTPHILPSSLESRARIVLPQVDSRGRPMVAGKSTLNGTLEGLGGPPTAPVVFTPMGGSGFAETNKMYEALGIRFDRVPGAADSVANIGDSHLVRLEEMCRHMVQKCSVDRIQRGIPRSTSTASAAMTMNASVSHAVVGINGTHTSSPLVTIPSGPVVPSTKFVEISITLTEVLQLQGRPKEAVQVLSKAIDEVNADMAEMRRRKLAAKQATTSKLPSHQTDLSSSSPRHTRLGSGEIEKEKLDAAPTNEEYDQLKKLKASCHRRIGSLYMSLGKYKEAEDHIKKYISYLDVPSTPAQKNEYAYTCSVLACIYDQLGKNDEATAADQLALEEATNARKVEAVA